MFDKFQNRLEITGKLTTITALRIGVGGFSDVKSSDLSVIKDAFNNPIIPGSSFKGAMRSRLESFLRGINPSLAEDPANFTSSAMNNYVKGLKEKHKDDDLELTQKLVKITDLTSLLFGSPWIASKFQVRDLTIVPDTWFGQYQERDGVAIDRDTETAAEGKLYDFQVVPAGTRFEFKAVVENAEDYELGLLMVGLHQFETEQIPLGGGRSRGLGVVKLEIEKMRWFNVENDPNKLLTYLKELVNSETGDNIPSYQDVNNELKKEWTDALIKKLGENIANSPTTEATQNS
ncbi:type III CRISPR-associated RAMP protein Csx7 [Anabaena azotica]|uniref:CRISPR-associated RAMP protein n=1 Tax=Anabaena azotica FACHB-119 TaxID=947527 RepID=A0ABR8D2Z9_9NOST|nr:CRISPR-associated RAMP protein Csx7 [Anabaena azotica]MBD2500138.1 CRISPR-associated RAMP protein [Anabaena azotica FACHB-119]